MIHANIHNLNKRLWKLKAPLDIKIFLMVSTKWAGVVLTKDNLAKHNYQGSKKCFFFL